MKVIYQGVKNGRPSFEFGDRAPPEWLRQYAARVEIKDGAAYDKGRKLEAGETIEES